MQERTEIMYEIDSESEGLGSTGQGIDDSKRREISSKPTTTRISLPKGDVQKQRCDRKQNGAFTVFSKANGLQSEVTTNFLSVRFHHKFTVVPKMPLRYNWV